MVLYICLFQNIMFAFMPEDDFGINLNASKKLKKIEMFFLTLCLLFFNWELLQMFREHNIEDLSGNWYT